MPRLPVDGRKVIEHRITLGQFERRQLEKVAEGVAFNQTADPIVKLLNDVTGTATLLVIFGYLFPFWKTDPATGGELSDATLLAYKDDRKGLDDYLETQNLIGMAAGTLAGVATAAAVASGPIGWLGLALAGLGGAAAGTLVVEGAEEVVSDTERAYVAAKKQSSQIQLMVMLGALDGGVRRAQEMNAAALVE